MYLTLKFNGPTPFIYMVKGEYGVLQLLRILYYFFMFIVFLVRVYSLPYIV
jgi:hypothetical protein